MCACACVCVRVCASNVCFCVFESRRCWFDLRPRSPSSHGVCCCWSLVCLFCRFYSSFPCSFRLFLWFPVLKPSKDDSAALYNHDLTLSDIGTPRRTHRLNFSIFCFFILMCMVFIVLFRHSRAGGACATAGLTVPNDEHKLK